MDFFTDASLNKEKKVAGISCVTVNEEDGLCGKFSSFFATNSIHVAELCALGYAVQIAQRNNFPKVRIVSDSAAALNRLHEYICCLKTRPSRRTGKQDDFLSDIGKSPVQKEILDKMVNIFLFSGIKFTFDYVPGHQKGTEFLSDGYCNNQADREATEGRLCGERLRDAGKDVRLVDDVLKFIYSADEKTLEESIDILTSLVSTIYVPNQPKKVKEKKVAHHKGRERDCSTYYVRIDNVKIKIKNPRVVAHHKKGKDVNIRGGRGRTGFF